MITYVWLWSHLAWKRIYANELEVEGNVRQEEEETWRVRE